ncbi:hypothetical protein EKD04_017275 [Chloroflexales bacterium ZM16-3]|nr:hypothetical protein [Chloroflexales bacterium ZM16-3]
MTTEPLTWATAPAGSVTLDGGWKGCGCTIVVPVGEEYAQASERCIYDGASPEPLLGVLVISPATQLLIDGLNPFAREDIPAIIRDAMHLAHNIAGLNDMQGGIAVGLGILRDNGWLPDTATYAQVDDLIATHYARETPEQATGKKLRTMGAAIAAGENPEDVFSWMSAMGPQQDDFALRIARRAQQATDINVPEARGLWPHIYE